MRMHKTEVVDALITCKAQHPRPIPPSVSAILATLARLYQCEGESGRETPGAHVPILVAPTTNPTTWEQSTRILDSLNNVLEDPSVPPAEENSIISQLCSARTVFKTIAAYGVSSPWLRVTPSSLPSLPSWPS